MNKLAQTLILVICAFCFSQSVSAAETSSRSVLGFTKDGRYFVFEEFGISDGIGLPYATIYAIDVDNDKWVPGSPARVRMEEGELQLEGDTVEQSEENTRVALDEIRQMAMAKADPFLHPLGRLGYGTQRGRNSPWELNADTKEMRFVAQDYVPANGNGWKLQLTESDFPAREEDCYGFAETMKGMTLTLVNEETGQSKQLAHDMRIPKSRPCPLGYGIEEVLTHRVNSNRQVIAVLIRFKTVGFEGHDGRLLAIAATMP